LFFSYSKLENRIAEQFLPGGLVPVGGGGKIVKEDEYNICRKTICVEIIPGMGGREYERGAFKYNIFDILEELLSMPQCTPS
jgi:hypothetical protein